MVMAITFINLRSPALIEFSFSYFLQVYYSSYQTFIKPNLFIPNIEQILLLVLEKCNQSIVLCLLSSNIAWKIL